jgi:hypothetical protein
VTLSGDRLATNRLTHSTAKRNLNHVIIPHFKVISEENNAASISVLIETQVRFMASKTWSVLQENCTKTCHI